MDTEAHKHEKIFTIGNCNLKYIESFYKYEFFQQLSRPRESAIEIE